MSGAKRRMTTAADVVAAARELAQTTGARVGVGFHWSYNREFTTIPKESMHVMCHVDGRCRRSETMVTARAFLASLLPAPPVNSALSDLTDLTAAAVADDIQHGETPIEDVLKRNVSAVWIDAWEEGDNEHPLRSACVMVDPAALAIDVTTGDYSAEDRPRVSFRFPLRSGNGDADVTAKCYAIEHHADRRIALFDLEAVA